MSNSEVLIESIKLTNVRISHADFEMEYGKPLKKTVTREDGRKAVVYLVKKAGFRLKYKIQKVSTTMPMMIIDKGNLKWIHVEVDNEANDQGIQTITKDILLN